MKSRVCYGWNDHHPPRTQTADCRALTPAALDLFDHVKIQHGNVVAVCRRENPFRRRAAAVNVSRVGKADEDDATSCVKYTRRVFGLTLGWFAN